MKTNFSLLICCFAVVVFSACKKNAGEGGTSTIKGSVNLRKYDNSFHSLLSESVDPNEDVYIIYGTDHETYDNDYKTSYDGEYAFQFLQKGTYKIFTYTIDTTGVSVTGFVDENKPKIPVFATVTISDNGSTVTAPTLTVLKNNKQGSSIIKGKVFLHHWDNTMSINDTNYYVGNQDVFIISETFAQSYFNDYKTSWDGSYYFDQLPIGNYRMFTYSPDTTGVAETGSVNSILPKIPIFVDGTITSNGESLTVPDIVILKFN